MPPEKPTTTIEISTRTIITTILIVLGLFLIYQVKNILLLFLVAATLASALEPLVSWSYRRLRLPRPLTVILVYLVVLGAIGSFFYTFSPSLAAQFADLSSGYQRVIHSAVDDTGPVRDFLQRVNISDALSSFYSSFTSPSGGAFQTTVGFVTGLLQFLAVLIISFYLVIDQEAIKDTVRQLVPQHHREKAMQVVLTIQRKLGFWLLGQLILSVVVFLLTFLGLSLLGVPFALALAALAGLLEIVPFLGPIIAAIPGILIAFTISPTKALLAALVYLLVQQAENYILVPQVMRRAVGAHPLMVLFGVLIGYKLAGIAGALLAVPIIAASSVLVDTYVSGNDPEAPEKVEELWQRKTVAKP